jgi:MYXO-CTERM domain-containing protein
MLTTLALSAAAQPLELAVPADPTALLEDRADRGFDLGAITDEEHAQVVGGREVKSGRWDDTVGVVFSSFYVGCTGTLIGPRVVLTAGHCVNGSDVTHVLVGSKDWVDGTGEAYEVEDLVEYPNSQSTRDIALLFLAAPVEGVEPRPIGMECITERYLDKGAPVQIVGFGATTESGDGFNTVMHEAKSKVLDPVCKETFINDVYAGCSPAAKPAGEVAAGGDGVDACFGDSGGPLYLLTDEGDFVIGATSRAFLGVSASYPCRDGGIWVRPDAVIDWILEEAGPKRSIAMPTCNEAPVAEAEALEVRGTREGSVVVAVDDADGDAGAATLEITVPPEHGTAEIDGDEVRYTADDGFTGEDTLVVTVTDEGTEWEYTGVPASVDVVIDVTVKPAGLLGCGCDAASGPSAGVGALGLLAALGLRRRR